MLKHRYMLIALILSATSAEGAEKKDPRLRDEDISGTKVSVEFQQRPDGLYSYRYTLEAPSSNLGMVTNFKLDLLCSHDFGSISLPSAPPENGAYYGNFATQSTTPVSIIGTPDVRASSYGITAEGEALAGMGSLPGTVVNDLEIVSPAEPGMRRYTLIPAMDNSPEWDYPEAPDPSIPWIPDFTVTGMIAGPGCPGVTPPVEDARFAGTLQGRETEATNGLLSYSGVKVDRWHEEANVKQVSFVIHYAKNIDVDSFTAQPGWIRKQLDPAPGGEDELTLTLKPGKNVFHFQVSAEGASSRKNEKSGRSEHDRDTFEIRRDVHETKD